MHTTHEQLASSHGKSGAVTRDVSLSCATHCGMESSEVANV